MAASRGAYTTSTIDDAQDLRRRNVPGYDGSNGGFLARRSPDEPDDKKTRQSPTSILKVLDEYEYILAPLIFTFFAFFTRMYKIGLSPIVTWDEAQ
jgi:dolichyl-phosphate-mannose-protein mannosyltransferase